MFSVHFIFSFESSINFKNRSQREILSKSNHHAKFLSSIHQQLQLHHRNRMFRMLFALKPFNILKISKIILCVD